MSIHRRRPSVENSSHAAIVDFSHPLPSLLRPRESDLGRSFEQLGKRARNPGIHAWVQFDVLEDDEGGKSVVRSWSLKLDEETCEVHAGPTGRPDLQVLIHEALWWKLADGSLTPLQAFGQGGMRLRGDVSVARSLLRSLRQQ